MHATRVNQSIEHSNSPRVEVQEPRCAAPRQQGESLVVGAAVQGAAREHHVEADAEGPHVGGVPVLDEAGDALFWGVGAGVGVGG